MSTNDVPGHVAAHGDVLAMGCWAEASSDDRSYIFVEGVENGRVIYSVFDTSKTPPVEYRDAMPEARFKRQFSWDPKRGGTRWTWHDKNPFPWDAVIQRGVQSGSRAASAGDVLSQAAEIADTMDRLVDDDGGAGASARRVARDLSLRGQALDAATIGRFQRALTRVRDVIQEALDTLRP
jgi:hypothetical protein